jgi:hypothetical protein
MSTEDVIESYNQLALILRDSGLAWIVEQVEDTVRTGRACKKQAPVPREREPGRWAVDERRTGKQERFTALRDYTPWERLELLIDAAERAVRGAAALETAVLHLHVFREVGQIVVAGEGERASVRSLDSTEGAKRIEATRGLERALAGLRQEARDER